MPAYIDIAYVKGLAPTATPDTSRDDLFADVLESVLRRIDRRTGQYFASGYTGYFELIAADISYDHRTMFLPRMVEIETLEARSLYDDGDDWSAFEGEWRKVLAYSQRWTGYDTLEIPSSAPSMCKYRVKGMVGYGHGADPQAPFANDPVPPEIKIEAAKQVRYDVARLPLGGSGGGNIHTGELATDMDGWDLLRSVKMTCKDFLDGRRLIFS